jgi:hypothetical protein
MKDLMMALNYGCQNTLRRLGLSFHHYDELAAQELSWFIAETTSLKKLDLSSSKFTKFDNFLDVLQQLVEKNTTLQYLNISGMSF